jgi:hypothetical protein
VVECDLAKVEVAGSNPVSRSSIPSPLAACEGLLRKGSVQCIIILKGLAHEAAAVFELAVCRRHPAGEIRSASEGSIFLSKAR